MLKGFGRISYSFPGTAGFIGMDQADHVVLPPLGVKGRLFRNLPENVGQVVQCVDHFFHIGVLITHDVVARHHGHRAGAALAAAVTIVDAVHVVTYAEWIAVISAPAIDQLQAIEQLHDGVDPVVLQLPDACPQTVEISLVVPRKIKCRQPISGKLLFSGPSGALKRKGGNVPYPARAPAAVNWQILLPEDGYVMTMRLEELDEGMEVSWGGRDACTHALEHIPGLRSGKEDHVAVWPNEIVTILRVHPERAH